MMFFKINERLQSEAFCFRLEYFLAVSLEKTAHDFVLIGSY
jgi:hypothetical protein